MNRFIGGGQREVTNMLSRAESVLEWYDEFQPYIPKWYLASV
ncbi:hypothetical protein [Paenibacillus sp. NPDC101420]